jgi:hypothetical protein
MFFMQEGFTYRNFLMDMIAIFAFVVWFWLLIVITATCSGVRTSPVGVKRYGS